jgi:hypothetical protein
MGFLLLLSGLAASVAPLGSPAHIHCALSPASHQWIQRALTGWSVIESDLLKLEHRALPWMIFYDSKCAWHVSPDRSNFAGAVTVPRPVRFRGKPIRIVATPHEGHLTLPDGRRVPAQRMSFAAPHKGPSETFFIMALPEVWRPIWKDDEPRLEEFFLGVSAHELAHTTQVSALMKRIKALKNDGAPLPANLTDDTLEQMFKGDADYKTVFERERDLFFEAAAEPEDGRARAIARDALALLQERHNRFLSGEKEAFRTLEGLFLNMEGIGSWVQHRMAQRDPANFAEEESIFKTKGRSTTWSQGEGLAMLLLVDRFIPSWQKRMLAPELASPIDLLREELGTGLP